MASDLGLSCLPMSHKKDAMLTSKYAMVSTYTPVSKDLFSLSKHSAVFHLGFQCLPMCPFRGALKIYFEFT